MLFRSDRGRSVFGDRSDWSQPRRLSHLRIVQIESAALHIAPIIPIALSLHLLRVFTIAPVLLGTPVHEPLHRQRRGLEGTDVMSPLLRKRRNVHERTGNLVAIPDQGDLVRRLVKSQPDQQFDQFELIGK